MPVVNSPFCSIAGLALAILFFMDNNVVTTILYSKIREQKPINK